MSRLAAESGHPLDEEAEWIEQARSGDPSAFEPLLRRYWVLVETLVKRELQRPEDIEDAVQETFVQAYRSLGSFREHASFSTWLSGIALNVARQHQRQGWVRRTVLESDLPSEVRPFPTGTEDSPESLLLQQAEKERIQQAVARLPDKLRMPLYLHFFQGLTYAQVAEVLHCPETTVWSRVSAGLQRLRRALRE